MDDLTKAEKQRARLRALNLAHNNAWSEQQWQTVCWVFGGCAYCGSQGVLTIDHVDPRCLGGAHVPENLVPACKHCNCSKNMRPLEQWRDGKYIWVRSFAREVAEVILYPSQNFPGDPQI